MQPKISVIVPVYRAEKYLVECIDSILAQSFTDFELILVDDGSPDNSGVICDRYARKDNRISVFHQNNGGVTLARMTGVKAAVGNWLFFADSDDIVPTDSFRLLIEASQQTEAKIIKGAFGKFDQTSHCVRFIFPRKEVNFKRYFTRQRVNSLCSGLFDSDIFKKLTQPPPELKFGEDAILMYQGVAMEDKILFIPEECYNCRENEESSTNNGRLGIMADFTNFSAYIALANNTIIENKNIGFFHRELVKSDSVCLLRSYRATEGGEQIFVRYYLRKYLMLNPLQWYYIVKKVVLKNGYKLFKICGLKK